MYFFVIEVVSLEFSAKHVCTERIIPLLIQAFHLFIGKLNDNNELNC
jgi:hypothetical protein